MGSGEVELDGIESPFGSVMLMAVVSLGITVGEQGMKWYELPVSRMYDVYVSCGSQWSGRSGSGLRGSTR